SIPASSRCSSASALRCRSRTPRAPWGCRPSSARGVHTSPASPGIIDLRDQDELRRRVAPKPGNLMDSRDNGRGEVASLMERILYEVKKIVVGQDHFLERV